MIEIKLIICCLLMRFDVEGPVGASVEEGRMRSGGLRGYGGDEGLVGLG